jgi:transcriptional regulator with XRE-family HTH domain
METTIEILSPSNGHVEVEPPRADLLAELAESVRDERRRQGMSQEALARASGIHSSEVSRIERGAREPRLLTLVRVARALEVTPSDLLRGLR